MISVIRRIYITASKVILPIFYKKEYLIDKWFDNNIEGWKWTWRCLWDQKVKGYNRHVPFPVNPGTIVGDIKNIKFDVSNIDNFWKTGCYYQCWNGKIHIGKGTYIAQNVGIITENHKVDNLNEHEPCKDVFIGENCWVGMNSVILPGVHLGDNTVVGAGAVVTQSFDGMIIGGVPARPLKNPVSK